MVAWWDPPEVQGPEVVPRQEGRLRATIRDERTMISESIRKMVPSAEM